MKVFRQIFRNPLFWIFLLALALRLFKLGEFPYGFHVDEVKVAWNALSILKTGHDDQNQVLGLYYNSFGDFRPSGIFYPTIPSIAIFGRNEFATRFPVALFGALTIFPIYFLIEILDKSKKLKLKSINTGYIGAFLMAISPWSIDLSRATNEVVISTFFAITSLYFFIKLIKLKKKKYGIFSIVLLLVSYLFYHAIRFLGPLFFITTFCFYSKNIRKREIKRWSMICITFSIVLTGFFGIAQNGLARLDQTSIFNNVDTTYQIQRVRLEDTSKNLFALLFDNKLVSYFDTFATEFGKYFSEAFLVGTTGRPYRFATPGVGAITYVELVLLIIGIVQVIRGKKNLLPLILFLLAPLPAAVTSEDAPNLSRAFMMLPFLIILEAQGFETLILISRKFRKQVVAVSLALLIVNSSYFLYMYFYHSVSHLPYLKDYSGDSPTYRDVGAKELSLELDSLKGKYTKIIITNFPDSLYPWYAFFTNKDPSDFNKTYSPSTMERDYGNIIFSQEKCPSDNDLLTYRKQNILMIDSWECGYQNQIDDGSPLKIVGQIKRPDGSIVYTLLERDWTKPLIVNGIRYD
jgi:4-amino-4-deoxy-L-arabinose transferase-like glycosyltransferase